MARDAGTASPYGWFTQWYHRDQDGDRQLHLMPEGDLREHTGPGCWCGPTCDPEDCNPEFWVHDSLDRREFYEANPGMRS